MAGGGASWGASVWGVVPETIPGAGLDPAAVRAAALGLSAAGDRVRDLGAAVVRAWRGLAAHYEAPEAPRLFAGMEPVERDTREFGDGVEAVAGALLAYADEIEPLLARLTVLRSQAWTFDDVVRRTPGWSLDAGLVAQAERLTRDVRSAAQDVDEAERRCAAAIRSTYSSPSTCEPMRVATGEFGGPWGPSSRVGESCARSALGDVRSFLDGVVGDGIVGGWLGTASLAGLTPRGFSHDVLRSAWDGVFDLAVPGSAIWLIRRPYVSVTASAWRGLVRGLVAADQWGDNPARAAGAVSFTAATAFLPGGGVKNATSGASAAARAGGRALALADDVVADAARVAGARTASPTTSRPLSRVEAATLDDALRPMKVDHVFASKHNFDPLVARYGTREDAMEQIVRSLSGPDLPSTGRFEVVRSVGGQDVVVRGAVLDGVVRIGTAFTP